MKTLVLIIAVAMTLCVAPDFADAGPGHARRVARRQGRQEARHTRQAARQEGRSMAQAMRSGMGGY